MLENCRCGSDKVIVMNWINHGTYAVVCTKTGCLESSNTFGSRQEAIDSWNDRPDYTEEPEIVEALVFLNGGPDNRSLMYSKSLGKSCNLDIYKAIADPDFIGFKYEDGRVMVEVRRYKGKHNQCFTDSVITERLDSYEVLTPTHVLFRSKP